MLMQRLRAVLTVVYILAAFACASLPALGVAQPAGTATLIVKITGLHSEKGQVKIALFNSPDTWLGDHPKYNTTIAVNSQSVSWKLADVPYGDYGIAVFHDENKNGKMDKNFLGIPQEPYGFSNNMRVTLGPPSWDKSKFVVGGSTVEVAIEVK